MHSPLTVIFIGPQGSGKGTQAQLLKKYLEEQDERNDLLHFETGNSFRELKNSDSFTGRQVRKTIDAGKLQPDYLAITLFSQALIESLTDESDLLIDGFPRSLYQAQALEEACDFYEREKVHLIHLQVGAEVTYERLAGRDRSDDTQEAIKERLRLYHEKTEPLLDFFKKHDRYQVVSIDGEQSIEPVHESIIEGLKLDQ